MAPSPSGKARVCKTLITSSNLVGASIIIFDNHILMDIKTIIYFYRSYSNMRCGESGSLKIA